MNILVTGANGQLGNEMRRLAAEAAAAQPVSADRYVFTDVVDQEGVETTLLDITDRQAVQRMVNEFRIEAIVNCAAYTNVDAAETYSELAERLNAEAPENLAVAMKEVGGLLLHISTDYVFGQEPYNRPCREDQQGTPTGVYGLTKLHGEQKIRDVGGNYVIVRTAWLYSEYGKNFVKTMLQLTATKPQLKVVFDQVGTPTYALDLARVITAILADYRTETSARNAENETGKAAPTEGYSKAGVYHFSNEGVCSWYDFTKAIAAFSGHLGCDIRPCHSEEFPSPVQRPAYSVLDKTKIKATFGLDIPYWTDSLRQCLANMGELNLR